MKFIHTPYIYILIFLNFNLYAQDLILKPETANPENRNIFDQITFRKINPDKEEILKQTDSIRQQLQQKGYLQNEIKSFEHKDHIYTVTFLLNKKVERIRIHYGSALPEELIKKYSDKRNGSYFEIPFDQTEIFLKETVNGLEASGNTFARVHLSNIRLTDQMAVADLIVERTPSRTIDDVIVEGYEEFPKSFISHRLHLKKGSSFNLQKLELASVNTKSLSFAREIKPPEVLFTNDSTFVYLFLKKKKSNSFDGLIGFSSKTEGSGLELNGYLDVRLRNIFNHGEHISLLWKSNGNDSQQFDLSTALPYIFNSPATPELTLNIYKQDTTFINTNFNFAVYIELLRNARIAALYHSENSTDLRNTGASEDIGSYKKNKYGLNFGYYIFRNDRLFPEKFTVDLNGFYANRKTDAETSNQNIFELKINYLWEINTRNYLFLQNQSGLINSDHLYTNELFRIGGINTVRGFNEESIPSSAYSIMNIEYRYKTTTDSYFYALTDLALLNDQTEDLSTGIYGFGLGYSFLTKAGRINLIYALGKFEQEPLNFNNSKLHIKIVNYF